MVSLCSLSLLVLHDTRYSLTFLPSGSMDFKGIRAKGPTGIRSINCEVLESDMIFPP